MTRTPRWNEQGGPDDAGLRAALHDARRGPSAAQIVALSARVAQRAAEQAAAEARTARGSRLLRRVSTVVGAVFVVLALSWLCLQTAEDEQPAPVRRSEVPHVPATSAVAVEPTLAAPTAGPTTRDASSASPRPKRRRAPNAAATDDAPAAADEVNLLQRARRALLALPERALALSREHEVRFPKGMFSEEREAIAIEALFRLGREAESATRKRAFYARYPRSTYEPRLSRLAHDAP